MSSLIFHLTSRLRTFFALTDSISKFFAIFAKLGFNNNWLMLILIIHCCLHLLMLVSLLALAHAVFISQQRICYKACLALFWCLLNKWIFKKARRLILRSVRYWIRSTPCGIKMWWWTSWSNHWLCRIRDIWILNCSSRRSFSIMCTRIRISSHISFWRSFVFHSLTFQFCIRFQMSCATWLLRIALCLDQLNHICWAF